MLLITSCAVKIATLQDLNVEFNAKFKYTIDNFSSTLTKP